MLFTHILKIYLFILRERAQAEEEERGGGRECVREISKHCTESAEPNAEFEPMNYEIAIWAKIKSRALN